MLDQARTLSQKQRYTMQDLLDIVALLRDPQDGCPWDKVQTHASIRKNFIEETYEVADAIDLNDTHLLCEELGDVLLQIALHAQMEAEQNTFSFEDVCTGICQKLIYRHPHIFQDVKADSPEVVLDNWEQLKRKEKSRQSGADDLDSVPMALPALMRAGKVAKRAGQHGFAYATAQDALAKLKEEVSELEQAMQQSDTPHAAQELGDVLFAAANLARYLHCDAEEALDGTTAKFIRRFKVMEQLAKTQHNSSTERLTDGELATLWKEAKEVCAERPTT